jgi:very-short-patch-repair endonuclease
MRQQRPRLDEVTVPQGVQARPGILLHRTRSLPADDRALHEGIPVTSPARTLIDLCGGLGMRDLEDALEAALRHGLVDAAGLRTVRLRLTGRSGLWKLDDLIGPAAADAPRTRSKLEVHFHRFCREHGLPAPEVNYVVAGMEVDAAWPHRRVAVEVDSFEFHAGRAAFERDRTRDAALLAAGWRIVRVTSRRMRNDGPRLAAELRRLLGEPPAEAA